ncbi:unnamed protein product, partial [marine sediment metagenome]
LGRFHLDGIPPAPRGIPQIEVTFDINADGILHVSAKDLGTGKHQAITITGHSGLEDDEIDKMVNDAEAHSEEDKKRRELIDLKNQADNLVYSLEKTLMENKDKIESEEASKIQIEIDNTKSVISSDSVEQIKKALETLTKASHKLTEMMYKQGEQQQAQQEAAPDQDETTDEKEKEKKTSDADDVIDAEVVDEDKNKS